MKTFHSFLQLGKDTKGFTIIEALIAILIVSFALLGIFRIHLQSVQSSEFSRRMLVAMQFGNSGIEKVRSLTYTTLADGTTTEISSLAQDYSDPNLQFLRTTTISTVTGIKRTRKALVTIGWDTLSTAAGGCGNAVIDAMSSCDHTVTLETYLTDLD